MSQPARQVLQAPITGQALRQSVAEHQIAEWTAYAQSLRVAGYRVDPARLAEQLLRNGCARVEDAFGHEVMVEVQVPRPFAAPATPEAPTPSSTPAATEHADFHIAC